ncbi:hypothetical protein C9I57_29395 [Trinickia symbiotica]|uniref:Uncharacterized protein n=1 Tax=Trinickia symbiotica TaxID=863227 RepID=A0A2T3XKZ1_9BURK|nr:hypothetical protein [Trinickia symbiotica]PTB17191.1 hypothetical protein C9I57_29395 [Trinickia symbiotica]
MHIAITGASASGLTSNANWVEVDQDTTEGEPAVERSDVGGVPAERHQWAERAIADRLRRSIAAQTATEPVRVAVPPGDATPASRARSDALQRQTIDSTLREWIDLEKAAPYADSPSQLLRAVSDHDHRPISPEFELSLDPSLLEDERVMDTAAVLYHQLRKGADAGQAESAATVPLATLRSEFVAALRDDYAKRRALAALAAPPGKTGQQTPFFDGFAIRHARHKTFDELAALPSVSADPAFASLTVDEKRRLLEKKFTQMGESTAYPIGTPEHSLATALLRLQSFRGKPSPMRFESPAALLKAFQQAERDWAADRSYPYHPRLLYAAHLARTDGVELMSPGSDQRSRLDALIAYGNERLLAVFGAAPRFARREAAAEILRGHGLTDDEIDESRNYVIPGDNPNLTKTAYGDRIDEFLDRADWSGLVGSRMRLAADVQIVPRDELQRAEERFNEGLATDAWVVARARENLWAKDLRPTAQALDEEVRRIASGLQAETEAHRAWVRGAETWINMVPVAGPIYNIEEGVRHHDAARAAFGVLFLGIDLFDLGMGAGGDAAALRRTHPVVPKMRHVVSRLDTSTVDVTTHPLMVEAAADPVDIAVEDGDIPLVHRSLAKRVRNGKRHVKWRDYDVVHLEHENRIVPVTIDGDACFEVGWRSGRRLPTRAPLERDPLSGKLSPRNEPVERASGDTTAIRGADPEARLTVKSVKDLVKRANSLEPRDFDRVFESNFEYRSAGSQASAFDFKAFCRKLYDRSPTFRRLVNRFDDVNGRASNDTRNPFKKWEVRVGEVGPLGSPTKAYTDFEHKRIYMPRDETLETMEYMTASGLRPMSREQVYLHETIHALTEARDPERMLDMLNRGPVVYLTDKILSEGGYAFAEQVMYRRQNSLPGMEPRETIEYHRDAAMHAAHEENRYLDPLLDGKPRSVPADSLVEGVPVNSRVTVRGARETVLEVAAGEDDIFFLMDEFETKFARNFGFFAEASTSVEVAASDAKTVIDFYRRLYHKSPTFRHLFDRMPVIDSAADAPAIWRIMLDSHAPADTIAQGASRQPLSAAAKEIYVRDGEMRYLSSLGVRDVEFERKLTYDMVRAIGGFDRLAPGETYTNRGAAVYLTDAVLAEAGFHYPRQLSAALATAGDSAAEARLAAYQTSAARSAAIEDKYLNRG